MAEKLDPRQVATFEELLRACLYEQEATRRLLVRKGVLTNDEVLEEIRAVRREMEGKRGNIVKAERCYAFHRVLHLRRLFVELLGITLVAVAAFLPAGPRKDRRDA